MRQTVAERVVERVDEALKADIMHWAAFYVRFPTSVIQNNNLACFRRFECGLGTRKYFISKHG